MLTLTEPWKLSSPSFISWEERESRLIYRVNIVLWHQMFWYQYTVLDHKLLVEAFWWLLSTDNLARCRITQESHLWLYFYRDFPPSGGRPTLNVGGTILCIGALEGAQRGHGKATTPASISLSHSRLQRQCVTSCLAFWPPHPSYHDGLCLSNGERNKINPSTCCFLLGQFIQTVRKATNTPCLPKCLRKHLPSLSSGRNFPRITCGFTQCPAAL